MRIAWISYFPIEWLPEAPESVRALPKQHPATWQQVLLRELQSVPELDLHIFAVRKQFARDVSFRVGNATFHCLKVPGGARTLSLFWWETLRIRGKLREIRPDVVHAWGSERAAALVASRLSFPYLVSMQGLLQWYQEQFYGGRLAALEATLEDWALKRARLVSGEASFSVNWLRQHYPRLDVRLIEHAPDSLFHKIRRTPDTSAMRFVFVGSVSPRKGSDILLSAFDRLKGEINFKVALIGSGGQALISGASPELQARITCLDKLSSLQVADELAKATIALAPSKADTGPVAVKEQVAAGVPVVGSIMGGIPDYVVPGKNGFLFPSGNLDAFVEAIRQACAHPLFKNGQVDPETHASMKVRLSPARMAESFVSVYREIAGAVRH